MDTLEKIEWDDKLSVDIPEIDELQKKMFALFNVLIDLNENKADAKECSNMVSEINEYCRYFFNKEEELLRRCNYPEVGAHAKKHRQFIKTTISLRRMVAEDKENLTFSVIKEMRDWLVDHIITKDLMYVPYVRIKNYIKESKFRH